LQSLPATNHVSTVKKLSCYGTVKE